MGRGTRHCAAGTATASVLSSAALWHSPPRLVGRVAPGAPPFRQIRQRDHARMILTMVSRATTLASSSRAWLLGGWNCQAPSSLSWNTHAIHARLEATSLVVKTATLGGSGNVHAVDALFLLMTEWA